MATASGLVGRTPSRRVRRADLASSRPGALWCIPAIIYFAIFAVAPMVLVLYLSFTAWNDVSPIRFIGLSNWRRLVDDPQIRSSFWISCQYTIGTWIVQTALAMSIGVWAAGRQRFRAVLSSIFFLPLLLSSAAIAIVWVELLDPNFGIMGWLGPKIGLSGSIGDPLGSPRGALLMVVLVTAWQFIPFHTLLYQGAARAIPRVLYDSALIDGCNGRRAFIHVTLPHLRNTIVTSSVIMIVGSLTAFDTVLILTNGGPGTSTYTLPFYMYTLGFTNNQLGYGSAIAMVIVVIATLLSLILVRITGYARMRSTLEGL